MPIRIPSYDVWPLVISNASTTSDGGMSKEDKIKLDGLPGAIVFFNPFNYGAVGDGVANDSPAFQAMWDDIVAKGSQGTVTFANPTDGTPGVFRLQTAVVKDLNMAGCRIVVQADGSAIMVGTAGVAMTIINSQADGAIEFRGLRLLPDGVVAPIAGVLTDALRVRYTMCYVASNIVGFRATNAQTALIQDSTVDLGAFVTAAWSFDLVETVVFKRTFSENGGVGARLLVVTQSTLIIIDDCDNDGGETAILDTAIAIDNSNFTVLLKDNISGFEARGLDPTALIVRQVSPFGEVPSILEAAVGVIANRALVTVDAGGGGVILAPAGAAANDIIGIAQGGTGGFATTFVRETPGTGDLGVRTDGAGAINPGEFIGPSTTVAGQAMKVTTGSYIGICRDAAPATPSAIFGFDFLPGRLP